MVDNQVSMSNLRNGLRALLHVPDSVAVLVSHVVWLGSLALFTWRHLRVKPRFHASYQLSLGLLLYLLFCPHLTFTEDILLLIPVLGLLLIHPTSWNRVGSLVVLATALNLGLCKAFYPTLTGTMLVLFLKLLLLGWLLLVSRRAVTAP
jgi:hypothetical protein